MAIDLDQLQDSPHLLDLLVQMEDVLDSLDVYVFKNWIDGELIDGPVVRRYWLDMTLRYPYSRMPDPQAALRLLKHGVRVDYQKAKEDGSAADEDADGAGVFWLVKVSIPRRLVVDITAKQLDFYDDEIDAEDVQDAKDAGMDDETAYRNPEATNGDASR